jgi:pantoate--beta-alanine ligase
MEEMSVGLVPTMGALHEGHLALCRLAKQQNHLTAVSIFVNPLQFRPGEDYENYPRDLEADYARLQEAGVSVVFAPEPGVMYPQGFQTHVSVEQLSLPMEGAVRPGHYQGVATVVLKLFMLARPTRAYFGEKDFQQLQIIRRMVQDLGVPVEIVPVGIVREPDGLAMSSRNAYLSPAERAAAPAIYASLQAACRSALSLR